MGASCRHGTGEEAARRWRKAEMLGAVGGEVPLLVSGVVPYSDIRRIRVGAKRDPGGGERERERRAYRGRRPRAVLVLLQQ